jgi:hypothetical protein
MGVHRCRYSISIIGISGDLGIGDNPSYAWPHYEV